MTATLCEPRSPLEQTEGAALRHLLGIARQMNQPDRAVLKSILDRETCEYTDDRAFHHADAERRLFGEAPPVREPNTSWYSRIDEAPSAAPPRGGARSSAPLTAAEERVLFHQFNYCRFRVAEIRRGRGPDGLSPVEAQRMLRWHRRAQKLRDVIVRFNLPLVLAMIKRTRSRQVEFAELLSEGNMALLRAVDKFDVSRGFKFSTYACRAMLKAFSRLGQEAEKRRRWFPVEFDSTYERSDEADRQREQQGAQCAHEVGRIVRQNQADLTDTERSILCYRFALSSEGSDDAKPMTLEQVGRLIGVTKERVRQLQKKALAKVRRALERRLI